MRVDVDFMRAALRRAALLRAGSAAMLAAMLAAAGPATAQTRPAPDARPAPSDRASDTRASPGAGADEGPRFAVTGFELRGPDPLPPGRALSVLAPFVGPGASLARLREAVAALEAALRAEGLGLYRVVLLPQVLQDRVALEIRPQRIDQVEVAGARFSTELQLRRALPALSPGATPDLHTLAAQAALANESPTRQLQVVLREGRGTAAGDSVDAQVLVREQRPWSLAGSLSNHGSAATGRDRFTLSGRHANLAERDIDLQGTYTTSLEKPQDVRQAGVALRVPLYSLGWQVSGFYTRSDVAGDFGGFTSTGAGHVAGIDYATYLAVGGEARHLVGVFLQDRLFEATRIDGLVLPGQLDRRSRPVGLRYAGRLDAQAGPAAAAGEGGGGFGQGQGHGDWQWGLEWLANTGWGAGNDLAAYQSEDPRITRTRWQALRLALAQGRNLAGWRLSWRTQGQWASTALIAGDQFGLGGLTTVRGTREERPLAGDSGWQGSVELSTPAQTGWRLAGFVDGGGIANRAAVTGRPDRDLLASAGLGLRWSGPGANLVLDWGRIIRGSRTPLSALPSAPQRGDERLYLALTLSF